MTALTRMWNRVWYQPVSVDRVWLLGRAVLQDDGRDLNYSLWSGSGFAPHIEVEGNTGENKNQPFTFLWH